MTFNSSTKAKNIHSQSGIAVDMIMKSSLSRKSLDNVTCVLICFENFETVFNKKLSDKMTKLKSTNYKSNPINIEIKFPKMQKTVSNELKISNLILKKDKFDINLKSPKIIPNSIKNQNKKMCILDRDFSSNLDKKFSSNINKFYSSFYNNDTRNLKNFKNSCLNYDSVKQKIKKNDFLKKFSKKDFLNGFNSNKNTSKAPSIEKTLKLILKHKSIKSDKLTNISNITTTNKISLHNTKLEMNSNQLDFSEHFSESQFNNLKKKFGLYTNDIHDKLKHRNKNS